MHPYSLLAALILIGASVLVLAAMVTPAPRLWQPAFQVEDDAVKRDLTLPNLPVAVLEEAS